MGDWIEGLPVTVIAHHLIWTNYGTWLANDPRGSGSASVYTPDLVDLGVVHYGRKKIQPRRSELRAFYSEAEKLLSFPVIRFDEQQRNTLASRLLKRCASSITLATHVQSCRTMCTWLFASIGTLRSK